MPLLTHAMITGTPLGTDDSVTDRLGIWSHHGSCVAFELDAAIVATVGMIAKIAVFQPHCIGTITGCICLAIMQITVIESSLA